MQIRKITWTRGKTSFDSCSGPILLGLRFLRRTWLKLSRFSQLYLHPDPRDSAPSEIPMIKLNALKESQSFSLDIFSVFRCLTGQAMGSDSESEPLAVRDVGCFSARFCSLVGFCLLVARGRSAVSMGASVSGSAVTLRGAYRGYTYYLNKFLVDYHSICAHAEV
jgi:hypothetical protein